MLIFNKKLTKPNIELSSSPYVVENTQRNDIHKRKNIRKDNQQFLKSLGFTLKAKNKHD